MGPHPTAHTQILVYVLVPLGGRGLGAQTMLISKLS